MKNKIYVITILIFCLFLSGCNVNYEIKIDPDLTVNETIYCNYGIEPYDEEYGGITKEEIEESKQYALDTAKENNYEVIDSSSNDTIDMTFKRTIGLSSFKDPVVLTGVYTDFKSNCNESFCSITAKSIKNDIAGDGNVTNYKISIIVPFKVIKNNADEADLQNNTYIWYYAIEGVQKNIELVFERYGKNIIEENKTKSDINFWIWMIILLTISIFVGIIIRKILRNNRPRL